MRRTFLAKFYNYDELIHWQLYENSYYEEVSCDADYSGYRHEIESDIMTLRKSRLKWESLSV